MPMVGGRHRQEKLMMSLPLLPIAQRPKTSAQPFSMRAEADRSGTCEKYETIKLSLGTQTQPHKPQGATRIRAP